MMLFGVAEDSETKSIAGHLDCLFFHVGGLLAKILKAEQTLL